MYKLAIDERRIALEAANTGSYRRGIEYYESHRVKILNFDSVSLELNAEVRGSEKYAVYISFSKDLSIKDYECSCPAYWQNNSACKHIVAALKAAQSGFEVKNKVIALNSNPKKSNVSNFIFSYFDGLQADTSYKQLKLEVLYEFESVYGTGYSSVELRIGEDKLYVVRNMKDFIKSVMDKKNIEFGKNFTFDPEIHDFGDHEKNIMELLFELYQNEITTIRLGGFGYNQSSIFKGKKAYLSDSTLKRLLNTLKASNFNARILGKDVDNIEIVQRELPLIFKLNQKKEQLILDFDLQSAMVPLTDGGEYIFYDGKIYNPSKKQLKYFTPFYHMFITNKANNIAFSGSDKERFVSEILPYFKSMGELLIDKSLENSFYREELNTKIYFDKSDEIITSKIEFWYGEEFINPFDEKRVYTDNKRVLIRDVEQEKKIIGLFEKAEFKVTKDTIYLEDEAAIFYFFTEILPKLQDLAEVYYSDAFKKMTIRDPRSIRGRVRLNEKSELLEFSFEIQDIDNEELWRIFSSIREKRRYYRLKDGSFMPLEAEELTKISELMEHLDIEEKDIDKKVIELPKYRALYLDNKLRESELINIDRNLAFKQMVQNIREPKDMEFEIPHGLDNIMRDYQKIGFKWMKTLAAYGLGGILADDMGLGKTLQAIAFVLSEGENADKPVLVIAPTSLVYNWQTEVRKFAPTMKVLIISGTQKDRQELLGKVNDADMVITSYPLIRRDIELYGDISFSYCFLDEAQHIKNPDSVNASAVKQIKAKGYYALTGTPIENSLTELWSIFDFIMPGYLLSHSKFVKRYETPIVKNKDESALKELSKQINPFILRRMKKDVLKELPEKIESNLTAELTPEQKKIYMAYLKQAKGEINKEIEEKGFERSHIKILSILTRLRQICCHPGLFIENYSGDSGKLLMLQEVMEEALEGGHRILLFSQFTSMLQIIKKHLEKEHIEYYYLDGSTPMEARGLMVRDFNNGQGKVFLISLKAGGTGLNLTGADTVIHFDPWWNPAVEDQASDRAYRIGQKNSVQVIRLITGGTIEEKVHELQKKKKEMIDAIIKPGESPLIKMTEEDFKELFEID